MKHDDDSSLVAIAALLLPKLGRVGASLLSHVVKRNDKAIVQSVINPTGYDCPDRFARDYQAVSLLSKYPGLELGIDRRDAALKSFRESELRCSRINQMFCHHLANFSSGAIEDLYKARDFISRILGTFSWDTAVRYFRFGPGASVGLPRKRSHPCQKIGNLTPTITGQCLPLFHAYRQYDRQYGQLDLTPSVVVGSVGTTVPKNAKTDRFIAIEPQLNMFFQKGIGAMIRSRLAAWGVDLDTQWVRNQELALRGSVDGSLATLDLSSASDSISSSLVEFLLPEDWCTAMKTVRSPYCVIDGEPLFLRKFSSMGNGFTFELESLIFLALVWSTVHRLGGNVHDVACFGDDIICPGACASEVSAVLGEFGFGLNSLKSFWNGRFRESCGKHYFAGRDVTPFFLKKVLRTPHDILWAANSIRRAAHRMSNGYGCSAEFLEVYSYLLELLPKRIRDLSCPDGHGDYAVVRDLDEAMMHTRPIRKKNFLEGWEAKAFVEVTPSVGFEELPALIQFLWRERDHSLLATDLYRAKGLDVCRYAHGPIPGVERESQQYARFAPLVGLRRRVEWRTYTRWSSLGPWL